MAALQSTIAGLVRARNEQQVNPFRDIIESHQRVSERLQKASAENTTLKTQLSEERDARQKLEEEVARLKGSLDTAPERVHQMATEAKSLKEENKDMKEMLLRVGKVYELEHQNQGLEQENTRLKKQVEKLEEELKAALQLGEERSDMVTLLKKENEALKSESQAQVTHLQKAQEENARLMPMILKAKQREAELMDQILELENQLCEMTHRPGGTPGGAVPKAPLREAQFVDSLAGVASDTQKCPVPSYIAHSTADAHDGSIDAVVVTENSRHIWTGGTDKVLKCWDLANGEPVNRVPSVAAALSIDSVADLLVTGCVDSTCRVYELGTMRGKCQLTGHQEKVTSACLSADAQRVFSASSDRTIKSWDVGRGSLVHTSMCLSACFDISVIQDRICSAHFDTTLRFWDARTGKSSGEIPKLHDRTITSCQLTQGGNTVVTLSRDNTVKVSDVRMMQCRSTLTSDKLNINRNHSRIAVSPDASMCATGSMGNVLVWQMKDPDSASNPKVLPMTGTSSIPALTWSPDGRGLVSVGDRSIVFWR